MAKTEDLVFVNCTGETFTPTISGAISTWIWEVLQAAGRDGVEPLVIARTAREAPWKWARAAFIEYPYPKALAVTGAGRFYNLQKKWMGWGHAHHRAYANLVIAAVRRAEAGSSVLFCQNDPHMCVWLRRAFPDSTIIHLAQNNDPCANRFRRAFPKSVNRALAVSNYCAQWNSEYFGMTVDTLYSGIDASNFSPAQAPPPGPPVINFVGRTDPPKGPDILLEACLLVARKTTAFSVQLLGRNFYDRHQEDEFQRHLRGLADKLETGGVSVRRPGWITRAQLPDELRKAHIHCIPARWDGPFGLTTVEGMACGLATVASRTGGTPEIVGDAGLLFERENVQQLASHLERLIVDEPLRREYAIRARRRAEEFTWDRTWQQIKAILPG